MSQISIQETISQFIESQFPSFYREREGIELTENQRAVLVDFVEAYFEWVEQQEESFTASRKMFEFRDIDKTPDKFIQYFKSKYLSNLNDVSNVDERFLIKHIFDLYRSKGSSTSIKLMMRLLYNTDAEIYFPAQDILRASDSRWIDPIYLEVISTPRSVDLVGKRVFGSISGAIAFVEAVVTKRSNNRLIDILYLSNVEGTFIFNDVITDDGILNEAPKVIGSLSSVELDQNSVGGNKVGDLFEINADFGSGGALRVTSVRGESGAVEFSVKDGGYGYTTDDITQILISDIVVITDNSNTIFETETDVTQQLEKIYLERGLSDYFLDEISLGSTITGLNETSNVVANAIVMEIGSEPFNNIITPYIVVQTSGSNTFLKNQTITLTSNTTYIVGKTIEEADDVTLEITGANGSFTNTEVVFQRQFYLETGNTVSSVYVFGEVVSSNSTSIDITNVFGGDFVDGAIITGRDSGAEAFVVSSDITFEGTTGVVKSQVANNEYIVVVETEFSGNNKIRGVESKVISEISSTSTDSVVQVEASNVYANVEFSSNVYFTGTVIGQNTTNIGIATTSNNEFIFVSNSTIISDGNTDLVVNEITPGTGADFKIGTLENTETVSLIFEKILDLNIFGVQYQGIKIDGSQSGVGYVESVTVSNGGIGYTNSSTVTFIGGGYINQSTLIPASATVTTDNAGSIVSINMDELGEGYFEVPTVSVSDGSGANLEAQMVFGYGFPNEILANSNTIIADALPSSNVVIGTIATLTENKPGLGYTKKPFITVKNPNIASFTKQNQIANITPSFGTFVIGEIVTVANSDARGLVLQANSSILRLRNISFAEDFVANTEVIGASSAARADINSITYDTSDVIMGENAVIDNFVIEASGVINSVAIVDSGLGYIDGESITIFKDGAPITGTVRVQQQGIAPGYWKTQTSHISSDKKLQDNDYWQEFSYDIRSSIPLNEYRDIFLDVLHLAGTKLFGSVVKINEEQVTVTSESSITQS